MSGVIAASERFSDHLGVQRILRADDLDDLLILEDPVDGDNGRRPDPEALDYASFHDACYFEQHRESGYRLRPALAGEWPMLDAPRPDAFLLVEVEEVVRGVRRRRPVCWAVPLREVNAEEPAR